MARKQTVEQKIAQMNADAAKLLGYERTLRDVRARLALAKNPGEPLSMKEIVDGALTIIDRALHDGVSLIEDSDHRALISLCDPEQGKPEAGK